MTHTRQPSTNQQRAFASASAGLLAPEQFARLRDRLADYSGVYLDLARLRLLQVPKVLIGSALLSLIALVVRLMG